MNLEIYKRGQGYWTRVMSAVGAGMLVMLGAAWLAGLLKNTRLGGMEPVIVQAGVAAALVLVCAVVLYYLIGVKPSFVDFLIATEGEMKKVNWSTRKEILGSTWLVIGMMILIGLLCYGFDFLFARLFSWMGVLEMTK